VAGSERHHLITPYGEHHVGGRYDRIDALLGETGEGQIDLALVACLLNANVQPESTRRVLHLAGLRFKTWISRIDQIADHFGLRHQFVQDFEPLRPQRIEEITSSGGIAARSVQVRDNTKCDRIATDRKNDRDR